MPLLVAAGSASAQVALGIGPLEPAGAFREQIGVPISLVCPASDGGNAKVYGTDVYIDSSPICAAAIHAGVLKPGVAGTVTLVMGKGVEAYKGSERNGVTSLEYGRWDFSYSFVTEPAAGTITWRTMWKYVPKEFAGPVELVCPPGDGSSGAVWGTDVYTTETSICGAAVHAGVINAKEGGPVSVTRAPGEEKYAGTERNGVVSRSTGGAADAFTVSAGTVVVGTPPQLPPPPPAEPPVTPPEEPPASTGTPPPDPNCTTSTGAPALCITLAGWTGAGAGHVPAQPAAPPLTVAIAGWTGAGAGYVTQPPQAAGPPPPLTVTLVGWTGVGAGYVRRGDER
jgi:hypothetical protein